MWRHPLDVLAVVEVVAVVLLLLGERLPLALDPLAFEVRGTVEDLPQPLADIGPLAEVVGDDVPHAEEHVGHGRHLGIGIDEVGGPGVEIGDCGRRGQDLSGERLKPPLPRDLGERELAGLAGEVNVLELLGPLGTNDASLELVRQLALPLDGSQDRLLAVGELSGAGNALRDPPDRLLIEASRLVSPIPGDEGNRVAAVEQFDGRLHAGRRNAEPLGDPSQIDDSSDRRGSHPSRE